MIDGTPRPGTVLTLSHWPRSSTPERLAADLSAQIVLRAIEDGCLDKVRAELATIDHYDEDGLVALAMIVVPGLAEEHSEFLVEVARVGDFGVVRDHAAAVVAFSIAAMLDPFRSPVDAVRRAPSDRRFAALGDAATETLLLLGELVSSPLEFESVWREETSVFDAATDALGRSVVIDEVPEHDLAVVRVDPGSIDAGGIRWGDHSVHPAAVNTSTERLRIATVAGDRFEFRFRYESWVRMATTRPRLRVDLTGLSAALGDLEPGGVQWRFDGARAIVPELRTVGDVPSGITPDLFVETVVQYLDVLDLGPPAWDPYV
jgi:hypothetical protein